VGRLDFGLLLVWQGAWWHAGWWQMKFGFVIGLTFVHHLYARWRKDFANDKNHAPARYYAGGTIGADPADDCDRVPGCPEAVFEREAGRACSWRWWALVAGRRRCNLAGRHRCSKAP
jgi:hypothetical protein